VTYLADTSTIVRLRRSREVAPRWLDAIKAGLVGVCPAVEAELTRSSASAADRDQLRDQLRTLFTWYPMPDTSWRFVERTQDDLITKGLHKGPSVVDLLVAATAQAWGLVVLHVDADFDTISRVADVQSLRADRA
jgi:predicted nucleic acid-binding protein